MKIRIPAFSLLELSFVLMIAGILLSFSLPLLLSATNYEKKNLTHFRLQEISKALKAYTFTHGNLPYPSKSITTDISFGEANVSCSQGIIPFKTLGLHPSMIKDGYNHYITYAPSASVLNGDHMGGLHFSEDTSEKNKNVLEVYNENKVLLTGKDEEQPAFVLVSHGPLGGYYLNNGERAKVTVDSSLKTENADNNLQFVFSPSSLQFDDDVFWMSQNILKSTVRD